MHLEGGSRHLGNRKNLQGASAVRRNGWHKKKVADKNAAIGFVNKQISEILHNDAHRTTFILLMLALFEHSLGLPGPIAALSSCALLPRMLA